MQYSNEAPLATRCVKVETAAKAWETICFGASPLLSDDTPEFYGNMTFEFMLDPRARFFFDYPPFMSQISGGMSVSAFFLTKNLSGEEMASIEVDLYELCEFDADTGDDPDYKGYAFVEWHSDRGDTVEDMWHLLWQCRSYRGHGSTGTALFIDKQSVSDHEVIVADII